MKKGISLVALVITVVVLIIITGTIILTAFNNEIIEKSEEAVFKNDIRSFQEDYTNKKLEKQLEDPSVDFSSLEADNTLGNLKEWIPSITDKYIDRIYIQNGILKADKAQFSEKELSWLEDLQVQAEKVEEIPKTSIWQLDDTKTVITAYLGEELNSNEDFKIPTKVKDADTGEIYEIQGISDAFNGKNLSIVRLIIPDNLTLNADITENISMKELVVGNNVTFNTESAIKNNPYVEKITIGNNVTIPAYSINSNSVLKSINIGKNLTILEGTDTNACLYNNASLQELNIGSFKQIGSNTLKNRNLLTKVVIEDGATVTATDTFNNCVGIKEVVLGNATISSSKIFNGCTGLQKLTISKNAGKNFPASLFAYNKGITTAIFEENSTVSSQMFCTCTNLKNIDIKDNVTFASKCFLNCTGLTEVTVPGNTKMSDGLFLGCSKLTTVNLGEGLTTIPHTMLSDTGITSIKIPSTVKSIGYQAIASCNNLVNVDIPNTLTIIGGYAFMNCKNLESIKIPSSVTTIGIVAFTGCPKLTITVGSTNVETLVKKSYYDGTIILDESIN